MLRGERQNNKEGVPTGEQGGGYCSGREIRDR